MFASLKCHCVHWKILNIARCNNGLHFTGTIPDTALLSLLADQVGEAFPLVPPWNLKAVTFVRVGLLALRPLTSRSKRERMERRPLLQARKCSFLAYLPFVSTHVRCYKGATLFSFHTHFPFEVFTPHFTSNYRKAYSIYVEHKRV
jgi:hypothetical protein